jgi:hypothetical protein
MHAKRIEGPLLDFWVAKAANLKLQEQAMDPGQKHDPDSGLWHPETFHPSTNWTHGGPLLSGEWYAVEDVLTDWFGPDWSYVPAFREDPLKWFMRAYVALQYGDALEERDDIEIGSAPPPQALP